MATYFKCLFFLCLFYPITADDPKSGIFKLAPRVVEQGRIDPIDNKIPRDMREWWFDRTIILIRKMSHEVVIDADSKFTHARYIKEKYEKSITFLIGSTAASIMDEFETMLVIYRRYSNRTSYLRERKLGGYDLRAYNEAFIAIQGLYHQIRVEEHLFNNAVERLTNKRIRMRKYRESLPASLRSKDDQQNTLRTRHNQQNTLGTSDNQENTLRTRHNQQNILGISDNQQNNQRTRHNQQDLLGTSDNQQNILRTIDNQQNINRFSKGNSFGLISPDQSPEVSDVTKVVRQNNLKSVKKPLWVYKEADEDKF